MQSVFDLVEMTSLAPIHPSLIRERREEPCEYKQEVARAWSDLLTSYRARIKQPAHNCSVVATGASRESILGSRRISGLAPHEPASPTHLVETLATDMIDGNRSDQDNTNHDGVVLRWNCCDDQRVIDFR